jgi:hypothetical protein
MRRVDGMPLESVTQEVSATPVMSVAADRPVSVRGRFLDDPRPESLMGRLGGRKPRAPTGPCSTGP